MYLLTVTMYEFGQFLRILLWISLPMAVIAVLVTTYLHYRNKRLQNEWEGRALLSGSADGLPGSFSGEISHFSPAEDRNSSYQGLLWMKQKYEEYREQMDLRYGKLKEELARAEKKYLDLLDGPADVHDTLHTSEANGGAKEARTSIIEKEAALGLVAEKNAQISFLQHQLDERIKSYHELEYQGQEERNLTGSLQGQCQDLQGQCQGLQGQYENLQMQFLGAQQQLENKQRSEQELHGQLEEKQRQIGELEGKLGETNNLVTELQGQLNEQQRLVNELNGQLNELQGLLSEKHQLLQDCETTITHLSRQSAQEAEKSAGLMDKLENNSRLLMSIYKELDHSLNAPFEIVEK
jgi:chromosome segregation ATPase